MTTAKDNTAEPQAFDPSRVSRTREQVAQARAWFDALEDVLTYMDDETPQPIVAAYWRADAALNAALNELDAAEAVTT